MLSLMKVLWRVDRPGWQTLTSLPIESKRPAMTMTTPPGATTRLRVFMKFGLNYDLRLSGESSVAIFLRLGVRGDHNPKSGKDPPT